MQLTHLSRPKPTSSRSYLLAAALLTVSIAAGIETITAFAQLPGDLDPTFGDGGKLTDWSGYATDVAIQPDGKIVAVGPVNNWFGVARYESDGKPDRTFGGGGGKVITQYFDEWVVEAYADSVAIQPDGKIVVSGTGYDSHYYPWLALVRYHSDGSLDTSFDSDGIVTRSLFVCKDVTVLPDGKIIVGGGSWAGNAPGFIFARFNPNGSLDTGFGSGGIVTTPLSGSHYPDIAYSIAIQSDGKIVAAGSAGNENYDFGLVRYHSNGSLDSGFGNQGIVITEITSGWDFANAVAIQADDKIVVAGRPALVRYMADGSLDTSFGSGGIVMHAPPLRELQAVIIQSDGKIVGAGWSINDFVVVRYNPNGTADTSFGGGDGISTIDFDNSTDDAYGMALDSEGRAVVVGGSRVPSASSFALARVLLNPASTDFDFDGDGRSDVSVFRPADTTWYLQQSTDGFSAANWGIATDKIVPADYDGDGKTDLAVYRPTEGNWYVLQSSTGTLYALNFGLAEDLPQPADFDSDGRGDVAVCRPSTGTWWINRTTGRVISAQFGTSEDRPVAGDYNGDGRADLAVFRPSNGTWYYSGDLIDPSHNFVAVPFGLSTDMTTPADFDGDAKTDIAVYRPSSGTWFWINSTNGALGASQFGIAEDIPTAADFDGDGRADVSVFRPSNGVWYRLNSGNGSFFAMQFGVNSDRPTPAAFRY